MSEGHLGSTAVASAVSVLLMEVEWEGEVISPVLWDLLVSVLDLLRLRSFSGLSGLGLVLLLLARVAGASHFSLSLSGLSLLPDLAAIKQYKHESAVEVGDSSARITPFPLSPSGQQHTIDHKRVDSKYRR